MFTILVMFLFVFVHNVVSDVGVKERVDGQITACHVQRVITVMLIALVCDVFAHWVFEISVQ